MSKTELRKALKALRNQFTEDFVRQSSWQAAEHILNSKLYADAGCVLGYLAFGRELSVDEILRQALLDGKKVCVPYILPDHKMAAAVFTGFSDLVFDRYGIRSVSEPLSFIAPSDLELILVPAVAYDIYGTRLGMGGGYYDRFLPEAVNASLVGVTYKSLLQCKLPRDEHDIPVQFLVCENGFEKI